MELFWGFLGFLIFVFGGINATAPQDDGRIERAKYVRSLINPGDVGAEIGVWYGTFAYHVLVPSNPSKLYLIDPWEYGLQKDYEPEPTSEKQASRDLVYEYVKDLFASDKNVEILRKKSEDCASQFPEEFFDYVYIDGEHSYEAVKRDLNNYFCKIKIGGYIIGDDYGWAGIMPAVQEFLQEHKDELVFLDDPYAGRTGGQFAIRRLK